MDINNFNKASLIMKEIEYNKELIDTIKEHSRDYGNNPIIEDIIIVVNKNIIRLEDLFKQL